MPRPDPRTWIHAPGDRRRGYEVRARLAAGGYGEVYEVADQDGYPWAMKLVRPDVADPRARDRALVEATVLKRIDHVNVVTYRGAFIEPDGTVVLVTELLHGPSLRDVLGRDGFTLERALWFGKQLAQAAAAAHAIGAVHRDIKPENVAILPSDVVRLFDFGLARYADVDLKTAHGVGTPGYVAPDQLQVRPGAEPDPRWDVYAIGIILFEMIARVHPFDLDVEGAPDTAGAVIERHLRGGIPRLADVVPGIPDDVSQLVAAAVARDPERRIGSAGALAERLSLARRAWLEVARTRGLTAELERIGLVEEPLDLDATLEKRDAPRMGRFGTEPLVPHVSKEAILAAARDRSRGPA